MPDFDFTPALEEFHANRREAQMGALDHLGNVLHFLSDLDPADRCAALDRALEYYNKQRPKSRVEPSGFPSQKLVTVPRRTIGQPTSPKEGK